LNYRDSYVRLLFDELVVLDKPSERIIITPPQLKLPVIQALGRRITVELRDSLEANTTYTLDFTSAIRDNHEKTALEGFVVAFSTGDYLDTLWISGQVLNAEDLAPVANVTVGLHRDVSDSAVVRSPFVRTSRTNEEGRFRIRNVAEGEYRVYGLEDVNRDYLWSVGERLAFMDTVIRAPMDSVRLLMFGTAVVDTVKAAVDSTAVDSVAVVDSLGVDTVKVDTVVKVVDGGKVGLSIRMEEEVGAFVELLNGAKKVVGKAEVSGGKVVFEGVAVGRYRARLVVDRNGNGRWDGGDYWEHRQPEEVIYYPEELEVVKGWEVEQEWEVRGSEGR
jgi:5-hydroxyisourate hydrolase-like protein (transthyretin family)